MSELNYASNPAEIPEGTLVDLFFEAADGMADHPALGRYEEGSWVTMTYARVLEEVRAVAGALASLKMERGDRAAILAENRPEWALADYGCLTSGIIDVPVYATLTPGQVAYILENSGARLVFVSTPEQLEKVEEIRSRCTSLEWVVVFDPPPGELPEKTLSWSDFVARGREAAVGDGEFRSRALEARPGDTATILYTSGTTGDPKGVMLSHNNLHSNVRAAAHCIPINGRDATLSFLPLSHVFQRMVDYLLFHQGCTIYYARSIESVPEDLRAVRPTVVVSVPRLYEKVYAKVMDASGVKGVLVRWASRVGRTWAEARLAGRRPGPWTALRYRIAYGLVFKKIYQGVGGRLRNFVSGGAPLSPEINKFFFSAGIVILEGYGLTETSPVTNVNTEENFPENFRIGTVGKPVPGTEIRIADDGEILVRGPQVMKGYYQRPEETREVLDEDGWFHTGDVGELDGDGFLRITDRKKDLIVTAGGKNVAPQPIENRLKTNRYFDQPVLVGDRERFITLMMVPDFDAVRSWARDEGIEVGDRRELLSHDRVQGFLVSQMQEQLTDLSSFETPKKLVLLDEPFTIEDGSLTPTQKVKRRVVQERHRELLKEVYDEANVDRTVFIAW
jgi:long-chain acyl-CoA synthetase